MDYISFPSSNLAVLLLTGGFVIFFLGLFLSKSLHPVLYVFAMVPGLAAMILGGVLGVMSSSAPDDISKAASEEYGIGLSREQVSELRYPEAEPEAGKEEVYGVTDAVVKGRWQRVNLIWTGEELQLVTVADDGTLGGEVGAGKIHGKPSPGKAHGKPSADTKVFGKPAPTELAGKVIAKPAPAAKAVRFPADR